MNDRQSVAAALGHVFVRRELFDIALTHRSYGTPNNERLEFLGDGVLNCVIADLLYQRFPELSEGDLSRLRAHLVRQDSLHTIARDLCLGEALRLGDGEQKSGGRKRPSMLADAVEALIGAVFLDAGFERAKAVVQQLYRPMIEAIDPAEAIKDAKTRLQEHVQAARQPLPRYVVTATQGEAHAQVFEVACELDGVGITTSGRGASRRIAEQQAAAAALAALART